MENSPKKSSQSRSRYQKDYTKLEAIFDAAVERSRKKKIIYYASDRLYTEDSRREMAKSSYKSVAWAEPLDEKDIHTEIISLAKEARLVEVAPSSTEDKDQSSQPSEKPEVKEAKEAEKTNTIQPIEKTETPLETYQRLFEQAKLKKRLEKEKAKESETAPIDTNAPDIVIMVPENETTSTEKAEPKMESLNSSELGFLESYYQIKQEMLGNRENQKEEIKDEPIPPQESEEVIDVPEEDPQLLSSLIDLITEPDEGEEEPESSIEAFTLPAFEIKENESEEESDEVESADADIFNLPAFEISEPEETEEAESFDVFSLPAFDTQEAEETETSDVIESSESQAEEESSEPVEVSNLPLLENDTNEPESGVETVETAHVSDESSIPVFDTQINETESNGEAIPLSSLFEKVPAEEETSEPEEAAIEIPESETVSEDSLSLNELNAPSEETEEQADTLSHSEFKNRSILEAFFKETEQKKTNESDSEEDTKPLYRTEAPQPEPAEESVKEVITIPSKSDSEQTQDAQSEASEKILSDMIVTGPKTYENVVKDLNVSRISLACVVAFFALFVILAYPEFLGFDYIGLVLTLIGLFIAWDMGSRNLILMCVVMLLTLIVCMMIWVYQTRIQVPMLHYVWFFLIPVCMGVSYSYINSKRLYDGFVKESESTPIQVDTTYISSPSEKINLKTIIDDINGNEPRVQLKENTVLTETPDLVSIEPETTESIVVEEDHNDDTKEFKPVDLNLDDAPSWEYETVIDDKPLNYDAPIEEYLEEEAKEKEAPDEKKIEIPSLSDFISVDQFGLSEEELQESLETQDTGSVVFGEIPEVSDPDDSDFSF